MRNALPFGLLLAASLWAQQPGAPSVSLEQVWPPETVVATVNGKPVTYGELQTVLRALPAEMGQQAMTDRMKFVEQYALLRRLSELAEEQKLDQKSPFKEGLAYGRMQLLYQAMVNEKYMQITATPEDIEKFYAAHKDRFTQARVKVIYISFVASPPPQADPKAKKALTEAEAKAKAEDLLKQIRAGADFVKLVKQHSEDATSADKDGDFGVIHRSDKIPDAIKETIFSLKPGEVAGPVRQPNGFYLFRVEEVTVQSLDEVRVSLQEELRNARFVEWMESLKKSIQIKVEIPQFFAPKTYPLNIPPPPK